MAFSTELVCRWVPVGGEGGAYDMVGEVFNRGERYLLF